ncbi:MAG: hypothetical protein ACFFAU_20720, partial [Candidatus Hodarchaeota archaeon]
REYEKFESPKKKKKTGKRKATSSLHLSEIKIDETDEEAGEKSPVSSDELIELEKQDIFSNGSGKRNEDFAIDLDTEDEGRVVCSECGALVDPDEITDEGCRFCGGNIIII